MTTFEGRPNTALLVVDVQNDVVSGEGTGRRHRPHQRPRRQGARRARPRHLGAALRRQHAGGQRRLAVRPGAGPATSPSRSSTNATATPSRTATSRRCWPSRQVGRVVVTGAQTDACIRSTLHGALVRGYDTTLVEGRPHDGGPAPVGRAGLSRAGHRPHQRPPGPGPRRRAARATSCPTADIDFGSR